MEASTDKQCLIPTAAPQSQHAVCHHPPCLYCRSVSGGHEAGPLDHPGRAQPRSLRRPRGPQQGRSASCCVFGGHGCFLEGIFTCLYVLCGIQQDM